MSKRLTFTFSVDGATLGAFLAEHADHTNIALVDMPDKRSAKALNGHALKALPAPKLDAETFVLEKLKDGPLRMTDLIHAFGAATNTTGHKMYQVVPGMLRAKKVVKSSEDGRYSIAPKSKSK